MVNSFLPIIIYLVKMVTPNDTNLVPDICKETLYIMLFLMHHNNIFENIKIFYVIGKLVDYFILTFN